MNKRQRKKNRKKFLSFINETTKRLFLPKIEKEALQLTEFVTKLVMSPNPLIGTTIKGDDRELGGLTSIPWPVEEMEKK